MGSIMDAHQPSKIPSSPIHKPPGPLLMSTDPSCNSSLGPRRLFSPSPVHSHSYRPPASHHTLRPSASALVNFLALLLPFHLPPRPVVLRPHDPRAHTDACLAAPPLIVCRRRGRTQQLLRTCAVERRCRAEPARAIPLVRACGLCSRDGQHGHLCVLGLETEGPSVSL